jgi:flavodoxin
MKNIISLCMALMVIMLSACANDIGNNPIQATPNAENTQNNSTPTNETTTTQPQNILIAYFSCTGNTRIVAEHMADFLNAALFEIVPEISYSSDDLNYSNRNSRSIVEQNDNSARPAIIGIVENMSDYDIVFLGYPIWAGQAPRIINTFLESYDFSEKTIIPFSTSNTTGISQSISAIRNLYSDLTVLDGINITRANLNNANTMIEEWISGLDITLPSDINISEQPLQSIQDNIMYLHIGERVLTATMVDNSTVAALRELLVAGDITIDMSDYGGFEKVGGLGTRLPTSDVRITSEPGDLILFSGNQFVILYAPNTWSYTRLGKINDITQDELRAVLGSGNVTVTLSLNQN